MEITNFSMFANYYRNMHRPLVDEIFEEKNRVTAGADGLSSDIKYLKRSNKTPKKSMYIRLEELRAEAARLDAKARSLWQDIIAKAEEL